MNYSFFFRALDALNLIIRVWLFLFVCILLLTLVPEHEINIISETFGRRGFYSIANWKFRLLLGIDSDCGPIDFILYIGMYSLHLAYEYKIEFILTTFAIRYISPIALPFSLHFNSTFLITNIICFIPLFFKTILSLQISA